MISEIPHIWRDFGNPKVMAEEKPIFYKTVGLAWEMGYTIAGPLVVLAFLGRFLDKKYGTSPIALLSGIFLAMMISGVLVFKKTKKIMEEIK